MSGVQNPRVTQADRDAAAAYMAHFRPAGWQNAVAQIPLGNADLGEGVQAFARHREAAEAASKAREAALVEALGRLVETVEGRADILGGYDGRFIGREIPNFTASIDAALTLAEDKDETLREALRWLNKRFHLHINPWPEGENYAQWLALAIVIAAATPHDDGGSDATKS